MRQITENVSPMSNAGRNTYVIEHITGALISLLKDKPLNDISISELCAAAMIGRASFYRNFDSKEDILREYINNIFMELIDKENIFENKKLSEALGLMFSHFEKYKNFFEVLSKRNLTYLMKDVMLNICGPKPEHTKIEAYSRAYAVYTLYGWIEVWFQRGMQETAEEIADMFKFQGL